MSEQNYVIYDYSSINIASYLSSSINPFTLIMFDFVLKCQNSVFFYIVSSEWYKYKDGISMRRYMLQNPDEPFLGQNDVVL